MHIKHMQYFWLSDISSPRILVYFPYERLWEVNSPFHELLFFSLWDQKGFIVSFESAYDYRASRRKICSMFFVLLYYLESETSWQSMEHTLSPSTGKGFYFICCMSPGNVLVFIAIPCVLPWNKSLTSRAIVRQVEGLSDSELFVVLHDYPSTNCDFLDC